MLRATLARRLGEFQLELSLELERGTTLALLGESGSGKTVTLRLLAGLMKPDRGSIALGGWLYFDSTRGVDIPAFRRPMGYVPQDYALFPHLSAWDNVAFGLRAQGTRMSQIRARVRSALERVGVPDLAARRPRELSGGQQQRVALARALVLEPEILLLDEPLSSLDPRNRASVREELSRLLRRLPCVTLLVTHSSEDAVALGGLVARLDRGRIVRLGPPDALDLGLP